MDHKLKEMRQKMLKNTSHELVDKADGKVRKGPNPLTIVKTDKQGG